MHINCGDQAHGQVMVVVGLYIQPPFWVYYVGFRNSKPHGRVEGNSLGFHYVQYWF